MAGPRIIGRGPINVDGVLTDWVSYTLDFDVKTAEQEVATSAVVPALHANTGWTLKVEFKLPLIGRRVTTGLSLGGYTGVIFKEHSLKVEVAVQEGTGDDDWKRWAVKNYKWTVDASKWEATDSYGVFRELVAAQTETPYADLAYASEYGSGDIVVSKAGFTAGNDVSEETISGMGAGELTSADVAIGSLLGQVAEALSNGCATPCNIAIPEGTGTAFWKSIEYKLPADDVVTATYEWQGEGEFLPSGS